MTDQKQAEPEAEKTRRIVHLGKLFNAEGQVSPLCASTPRALNLKHESWTVQPQYVTCFRCLAKVRGC